MLRRRSETGAVRRPGILTEGNVARAIRNPAEDKRRVGLISDVLPFDRLWYDEPNAVANAIGYAEHRSRVPSCPRCSQNPAFFSSAV